MSNNQVFRIVMKDGAKLQKTLQGYENKSQTALKRTVSDFKSRAPTQIKNGIQEKYNVDNDGIKKAGPRIKKGASIKIAGIVVDDVVLEYEGTRLTPLHFSQSPKGLNKNRKKRKALIPGQTINFNQGGLGSSPFGLVRMPARQKVTATIIKGQKVQFDGAFTAPAKKTDDGSGPYIPFQRRGDSRGPTHAIHTLSVPQMIDSKRANDTIHNNIDEFLEKRLENHINQAMK